MTNFELLQNMPYSERYEYVYMWFYKMETGDIPFYVGIGRKNRYKDRSSRSKLFKEFLRNHECYSIICVKSLTPKIARMVEKAIKSELKVRGISLLDGEDNAEEHKKRQRDGITHAKKRGVRFGRPPKVDDDEFQKFLKKQKDGELTIVECCKQMGISRRTWYDRTKEVC